MQHTEFSSLSIKPELLESLAGLQYQQMTPIQSATLPHLLQGRDLIAQAQTGSGKTAAFALAALQQLHPKHFAVQALILCPTRELADQVAGEVRRLARGLTNIKVVALCGGSPLGPQIASLEHGAHVVVGTPGRIEEHLDKRTLELQHLRTFVLDEADRMLDMGFRESLQRIMTFLPEPRQNLLFSATYPEAIGAMTRAFMQDPVRVQLEAAAQTSTITQQFCPLAASSREEAVRLLLLHHRPDSALVFCNTKKDCQALADDLARQLDALDSAVEQQLNRTVLGYVLGNIDLLVGIDRVSHL